MQYTFNNILEFCNYKKKCPFCQNKLKVVLTNFIGLTSKGFPVLNAKLKDNLFKFYIKYDDFDDSPVEGVIDPVTNILNFNLGFNQNITTDLLIESFKKVSPHLELYCSNRNCKANHRYYLATDVFLFDKLSNNDFSIRHCNLYMEAFTIKNLWIQNDWVNKSLNIFNKDNPELSALKYNNIVFDNLDKDKIINKIMMMATFS